MTLSQFEDFLVTLKLPQLATLYTHINGYEGVRKHLSYWENQRKNEYIPTDALFAEWYTGGMSGGNCWDDTEPSYRAAYDVKPEELTDLDQILQKIRPQTSFLEYRTLTNKLVKHGTRSESEYYGNTSEYAHTYIIIKDLYNYLNEKGWLDDIKLDQ
jgi:hypothetical protein